jgi:hypothetical protein
MDWRVFILLPPTGFSLNRYPDRFRKSLLGIGLRFPYYMCLGYLLADKKVGNSVNPLAGREPFPIAI